MRLFARILVALILASPPLAHAQPAASPSETSHEHAPVVLTIEGAPTEAPALADTIRELLARLDVPIADVTETNVFARIHVDLTSPAEAIVAIEDGRTGTTLERRTFPRDSSGAIVREEIAHAVLSTIEAKLLLDHETSPPLKPKPPESPPPEPAPVVVASPVDYDRVIRAPASSPIAIDIATLGGAGIFASNAGAQVHVGGGVVVASRNGIHPSLGLSFLYGVPFDSGESLLTAHTSFESVRAAAGAQIYGNSWFSIDIGAGGGVDVLAVSPRSSQLPSSALASSSTRVDPVLSASTTASFALTPSVVFALAIGADVDLTSRHYVIDQGSNADDVFVPWRVRPLLLASITFTAHGDARFGAR